MSSSFQSTAFTSSASPVDTFVAPPSVQPMSGLEQLANTLSTINPSLQKYIGTKMETAVEKEKEKGFKLAIDTVLSEGTMGGIVNDIRKKDGNDAATQLIGGSIFADRAYSKAVSSLYSSQLNSNMQQAYYDAEIDDVDSKGNPIKKSLRSYSPSDPKFINWYQGYVKDSTDKILNSGGDIDSTEFITNLKTSVFNINKIAREENNKFKVEKIKSLSIDYLNKASQDWLDGNREESKIHITKFIDETRRLGLTGGDASDVYKGLVESIANVGQYYVTTADVNSLDEIDDLIIGLGKSIPYGNNNGNLTQHPLWQEKIEPVLESLEDELFEELTQGPKIDKFKRGIKLENKLKEVNLLPINTPEERAIYKQEITKLKNNREFSDLNEIFKSNNFPFIENFTSEILNIRVNMKLRNYEDNENPSTDLGLIKNKIVDLGITDQGILTDLEQAIGIASDYKSIYEIFDNKVEPLLNDMNEFYRSKAKSNGNFGSVNLGGGITINGGGLDNDSYLEKYNNEQEIDNNFEAWIKEKYYQEKDGVKIGGPSDSDITDWLKTERERIEKEVFGIKGPSEQMIDDISNRPVNERRGFGFGNKDDDFNERLSQTETPAFGNSKFEVDPSVVSEVSDAEAKRIIEAEDANDYLIQAGDTLSAIAESFGITVRDIMDANNITDADLINIGQQLTIPEPKPLFIDQYKGKAIPDFGGLGKLVISGESAGHGIYNAFNKGTTASAGTMDITSKTIAEMEQMQSEGKVFAVGAYQLTPGVLTEAREVAGIDSDAIMTPAVQDRLFWGMLTGGQKRPKLTAYLLGESDDLNAAHEALALEFAVIQGPDGKGRYDKDKSGNVARIKAALVKQALIKARKEISNK
tara:strand:+ start:108 stop:2708 length:2601 start_codon:yes stop_codon:yes gene_type:complete